MFLLPVLDIMDGAVVRGVGGRRSEYRPVVSRLTRSVHPLDVATAFRDHFGLSRLYVADLDAIAGKGFALKTFAGMCERGFQCWVDAGVREADDALPLLDVGVAAVVAGLETMHGPRVLEQIVAAVGHESVVFSLDLRDGEPLGDRSAWAHADALAAADLAIADGVRSVLVLDLARVGIGGGTGTESLCLALKERHPKCRVLAGGGVRNAGDLSRLDRCGVDGVLLASALHDGSLTPADVDALRPA